MDLNTTGNFAVKAALSAEGQPIWLTTDGQGMGLWRLRWEGRGFSLTPEVLADVDSEDLIGKTGIVEWRSK